MRGREREWNAVLGLLHRGEQGCGGVLLIDGEQGTGKSLLLGEAATAASARGFRVASAAADEFGQLMPLAPLLASFTDFPDTAVRGRPGRGPAGMRTWLVSRLRTRLAEQAATGPVLVALDDLQWADPHTLRALRALAGDLASGPVLWSLARRTRPHGDAAERLFGRLEAGGATRVSLPPLREEDVAGLVTDALGSMPSAGLLTLAAGASGNPLLLSELVAGLCDEGAVRIRGGRATLVSARLPLRIQAAVQRRLAGLSRRAWQLMETAAVLGPSVELDDVAEMIGESPAALLMPLQEALEAGVMFATEDTVMFRSELERQSVAESMPARVRQALHRQLGEILAERGCAVPAAAHLLQGASGGDTRALRRLDRAVAEILPSSPPAAAEVAAQALALTAPADPGRADRTVAAIESLTAAGRLEEAAATARAALAAPLPGTDCARVRCALSAVWYSRGEAAQATAEAERALHEPGRPGSLRDDATVALLHAAADLPDPARGAAEGNAILAAPQRCRDDVVVAALTWRAAVCWDAGLVAEGLARSAEAARRADELAPEPRRPYGPAAHLGLAARLADLGLVDEAAAAAQAAQRRAGAGEQIIWAARLGVLRARLHLAAGHPDEAAAEASAAMRAADPTGAAPSAARALAVLSVIALRRGDLHAAGQHLRRARAHGRDHAGPAPDQVLAAQIAEARGGATAAAGLLSGVYADLPRRPGLLLADPAAAAWLTRVALAAGDRPAAQTVVAAASSLGRAAGPGPAIAARAAHARGILDQSPGHLEFAMREHADPWARASAAEDLAAALAHSGDGQRAVTVLDQALAGYQQTGALRDGARVRGRLRALGVRRRYWTQRERPVTGWASLTDAERAISDLVAQGMTNRQVAAQMFVSVHTVAFHLRQVFRKLGVRSRVELTRLAMEQRAADPGRAGPPRLPAAGLAWRPGSRSRGARLSSRSRGARRSSCARGARRSSRSRGARRSSCARRRGRRRRSAVPRRGGQHGPEQLAVGLHHAGQRDRVHEAYLARVLHRGQVALAELDQVRGPGHGVLAQLHERDHLLAVPLVRAPHDGGSDHVGVLHQHVLDVAGVHVVPAADDQVLDPVHDVQVAVLVEPAHVAGVQPAAAHHQRGLRLGVPVPAHQHRAAHADLAVLGRRRRRGVPALDADRHARRRTAHAADPHLAAR